MPLRLDVEPGGERLVGLARALLRNLKEKMRRLRIELSTMILPLDGGETVTVRSQRLGDVDFDTIKIQGGRGAYMIHAPGGRGFINAGITSFRQNDDVSSLLFGNVDWASGNTRLTFKGPAGRYWGSASPGAGIYERLEVINAEALVWGVAKLDGNYVCMSTTNVPRIRIDGVWADITITDNALTGLTLYGSTPWFFNSSGNEAMSVLDIQDVTVQTPFRYYKLAKLTITTVESGYEAVITIVEEGSYGAASLSGEATGAEGLSTTGSGVFTTRTLYAADYVGDEPAFCYFETDVNIQHAFSVDSVEVGVPTPGDVTSTTSHSFSLASTGVFSFTVNGREVGLESAYSASGTTTGTFLTVMSSGSGSGGGEFWINEPDRCVQPPLDPGLFPDHNYAAAWPDVMYCDARNAVLLLHGQRVSAPSVIGAPQAVGGGVALALYGDITLTETVTVYIGADIELELFSESVPYTYMNEWGGSIDDPDNLIMGKYGTYGAVDYARLGLIYTRFAASYGGSPSSASTDNAPIGGMSLPSASFDLGVAARATNRVIGSIRFGGDDYTFTSRFDDEGENIPLSDVTGASGKHHPLGVY